MSKDINSLNIQIRCMWCDEMLSISKHTTKVYSRCGASLIINPDFYKNTIEEQEMQQNITNNQLFIRNCVVSTLLIIFFILFLLAKNFDK